MSEELNKPAASDVDVAKLHADTSAAVNVAVSGLLQALPHVRNAVVTLDYNTKTRQLPLPRCFIHPSPVKENHDCSPGAITTMLIDLFSANTVQLAHNMIVGQEEYIQKLTEALNAASKHSENAEKLDELEKEEKEETGTDTDANGKDQLKLFSENAEIKETK